MKRDFSSKGDYYGEEYHLPLRNLLSVIDVGSWLNSINRDNLITYCKWAIFRGHNKAVPQTLYDPISAIGSNMGELRDMVIQTFNVGITSKLLENQPNTIAIYNEKKFNDFCESKMTGALSEILERD